MEQKNDDFKKLITEVIKKQMVILGPDITLAKARNVKGLKVEDDGTVSEITGSPQELTQDLVNQFVELSSLIVQKTMEPLLANYPGLSKASSQIQMPSKGQSNDSTPNSQNGYK